MDKPLKIIVSGGGTGGHVFPAIAIANAVKEKRPDAEFLFVGAKGKIEMDKVPQAGYSIKGLWISGFHRKFTLKNLMFPFKLGHSLIKAFSIVRGFKPDLALGVGGYASGPVLQVANMLGVPALIQEQNAYPGVTNRLLAAKVEKICVAFDGMDKYFQKDKIVNIGNPVRDSIIQMKGERDEAIKHFGLDPAKRLIFITGGSLGARGVNDGVKAHLQSFYDADIQLLWQCGKLYLEESRQLVAPFSDKIKAVDFISRMDQAYIGADLIISRAGGVIAELCIVGKPVILMPSPNVAEDHQTSNAMSMVNVNAADMVKDTEAPTVLFDKAMAILNDRDKAIQMGKSIKALARPNAASQIADQLLSLIKN